MSTVIRFLLLTEDTGEQAFATQRGLAEKMLHLIAEGCAIHRVAFAPGDKPTRDGMGFNAYNSAKKRDYRKKVDLAAPPADFPGDAKEAAEAAKDLCLVPPL